MGLSLPHLIILALVVLLLFGRGKISELMGDFGKGIKSFKEGVTEESGHHVTQPTTVHPVAPAPPQIAAQPMVAQPAPTVIAHPVAAPAVAPQPQPAMLNGEPLPEDQR